MEMNGGSLISKKKKLLRIITVQVQNVEDQDIELNNRKILMRKLSTYQLQHKVQYSILATALSKDKKIIGFGTENDVI